MRSDPRIGMMIAFAVAVLSAGWIAAQAIVSDQLFAQLGYGMHALTFVSIFLLVAGVVVALLFRCFASVRQELLDGTNVIARWTVDADTWSQFAKPAAQMERGEKQALLLTMYALIALVCGGLALAVTDDAAIFGWIAVGIAVIVTAGFLAGQRSFTGQLEYRGGDVIVGRRGALVNGVLHVWDAWLSWLEGAAVSERKPAMLCISYGYWARYGPQSVTVRIPFAPQQASLAMAVRAALAAVAASPGKSTGTAASTGQPGPGAKA